MADIFEVEGDSLADGERVICRAGRLVASALEDHLGDGLLLRM